MSIINEEEIRKETLVEIAKKMMIAARTAPKAKGIDNLVITIAEGETISKIAAKMKEMVENGTRPEFYLRDAGNILVSDVILLIGTRISPAGIKQCGLCGFRDCEEKGNYPETPCSFNTGDLGIAIGSVVSAASDSRVDNRVMMSVGMAAKEMKLLGEDVKIVYGIPLSCSGKSPFFDRK
ncbi:MAG: ferredoxin [Fibrobacter sp.]|nr:ferredoxin [Fibrobacter sp.]